LQIGNWVKETTVSTGDGDLTLEGAFSPIHKSFVDGIGDGELCHVLIDTGSARELSVCEISEGTGPGGKNQLINRTLLDSTTGSKLNLIGNIVTVQNVLPGMLSELHEFFATAEQGALADTAVQPPALQSGALTPVNRGTISSGTFAPEPSEGAIQYIINGGAFTLAPPVETGAFLLYITNNSSAGIVTVGSFDFVLGDVISVVDEKIFECSIVNNGTTTSLQITNLDGSGAGVTNHGDLSGLTDDDHPQYLLASSATNRSTFASNWTDLTDTGDSTLHFHSSDRSRSNHSGTQTASTISDFNATVTANADVAANTAARHVAVTVLDSDEIDFTLNGQEITAVLKANSIDEAKLDSSVNASLDLADTALQSGASADSIDDSSSTHKFVTSTDITKLGYITVTQAVDLDSMESDIAALSNAVVLKGTWDASAGTFPGAGSAQAGWSYIVSVTGTVDGIPFTANDRLLAIVNNASTTTYAANWHKLDYTDQVLSVNSQTGAVVLNHEDVGFATGDVTKLAGIEANADVTDAGNVGSAIHGATAKTTPVDADTMALIDSAASNVLKKVTWANVKATIKTYYDSVSSTLTNKTISLTSNTLTATSLELKTAISDETGSGSLVFATSPTLVTPALGTPTTLILTNATGLPTAGLLDGAVTLAKMANLAQDQFIGRTTASTGVPQTATITSAARTVLDDTTVAAMVDTLGGATSTGTGGLVRITNAALVTPNLGTPSSLVLTNATGLPTAGLVDGAVTLAKMANLAQDQFIGRTTASTGVPQTATITSAARTVLDDTTVAAMVDTLGGATSSGTGGLVRITNAALVTPNLGTPTTLVLTNATGLPTAGLVDGAVTLAKMANLAQDQFIGRTTASTGVPQTATITAAARTVLDDTSVANMVDTLGGAASSGTGGLVRITNAALVTPNLGTPSTLVLTNATGLTTAGIDAATLVIESEGIAANDNDTTIPTSAAVKDYVDTNAFDPASPGPIGGTTPADGTFTNIIVGTQANKATISYTTNTARTLTIPNVGGNRTFSFINQAETFSAVKTFSANPILSAASATLSFNNATGDKTISTGGTTNLILAPGGAVTQITGSLLLGTQANKATITYATDTARLLTIPNVGGDRTFSFIDQAETLTDKTLVAPALGTPISGTLTNCTDLPIASGISGLAAGIATFLATPSSANLISAVTDETGSGSLVFATSPVLVTPNLGTPSALVLTNATGLPTAGLVDGAVTLAKMANLAQDQFIGRTTASTGVPQTATITSAARTVLDDTTVAAMVDTLGGAASSGTGGLVRITNAALVTPNLGTPSTLVLTNATGLPTAGLVDGAVTLAKMANLAQDQFIGRTTASTGVPQTATITSAARTVLDDTSVANMVNTLGGATSTGTGGLVRITNAALVTPNLGTPSSLVLTNATGLTTAGIAAATLVIESETITSNDNDTTIPTSAAVKNYADSETATLTNKTINTTSNTITVNTSDISDFNITAPSDGETLVYDSGSWVNQVSSGGLTAATVATYVELGL